MTPPLSIRQNNPGNIRPGADKWRGEIGAGSGFVIFDEMSNGIRALAKNIIAYYENSAGPKPKYRSKNGTQIDTVEEAIDRWAPSTENDTSQYTTFVCGVLGCQPDDVFDFHDPSFLFWMVTAIGEEESGHDAFLQNVTDADITAGVAAALA